MALSQRHHGPPLNRSVRGDGGNSLPSGSGGNDWRARVALALALTAIHFGVGIAVLAFGHPHEDAYILFKYARELATGHGIVYFPGGPHAEGATDFLWMVLLAGGRGIGIDVAVGAAIVNSCGFFACALSFLAVLGKIRPREHWPHLIFLALLLVSPCAVAGYVGFSAMAFASLALYLYGRYAAGTDHALLAIPSLALALALVRPDGVILGAGFALLGLWQISPSARGRYLAWSAVVMIAGAAYFAWRWRYFGNLLPLPLYVKSHYWGAPPGIEATEDWALSSIAPLILLHAGARVFLGPTSTSMRRHIVGLLPFAAHALSFTLGTPSQNVALRFQSPATLALLFASFVLAVHRTREPVVPSMLKRLGYVAVVAIAFVPHFTTAYSVVSDSFWLHYMNVFGHRLATVSDENTHIATTEAGRMAYWTDAKVIDLVGLNTLETALRPPTTALLAAFDPDVVMMHHAGTLDEARFGPATATTVIPITGSLGSYIFPWARGTLRGDNPPYAEQPAENIVAAPIATTAFLDAHADAYELWAVPFKSRAHHFHVYAIKRSYPRKAAVLDALRASEESPRTSYLGLSAMAPPR